MAVLDKDRDGVSDEQKVLVKGLAFDLKGRPADHTTNGIEIGIDGWIYIAVGDFGFMEAEGTDGRKLQLRGGGPEALRASQSGPRMRAQGQRGPRTQEQRAVGARAGTDWAKPFIAARQEFATIESVASLQMRAVAFE